MAFGEPRALSGFGPEHFGYCIDKKSYETNYYYSLDVIISVGYRVKSLQGTEFRQWATARLREYIVKGRMMNDEPTSHFWRIPDQHSSVVAR